MIGVRYISELDPSGYGIAGRAYLHALVAAGVPVTWTPMVRGRWRGLPRAPYEGRDVGDPVLASLCHRDAAYDTVIAHMVPEYYPHFRRQEPECRLIGYTVWESTALPDHWPALLNGVDGLMVPTRWNRDLFVASGVVTPVSVVPHILEVTPRTATGVGMPFAASEDDFVFYTLGEWNDRKDMARTIRAYLTAFTGDDPVLLVVKTSAEDRTRRAGSRAARLALRTVRKVARQLSGGEAETVKAVERLRAASPNPARIAVIARQVPRSVIHAIHSRGDCFVSLTRGEGWGLGAFEAAAAGNPVIIARFGGPDEFLEEDAADWIDYDLVAVRSEMSSYSTAQRWAKPSLEHATKLMRDCVDD